MEQHQPQDDVQKLVSIPCELNPSEIKTQQLLQQYDEEQVLSQSDHSEYEDTESGEEDLKDDVKEKIIMESVADFKSTLKFQTQTLDRRVKDVFRRSSVFQRSELQERQNEDKEPEEQMEKGFMKDMKDEFNQNVKKMMEIDEESENDFNENQGKEKKFPQIDFKKLLKREKISGNIEFPFTGVQVEDTVFINNDCSEMISLECIFYMTDCSYKCLQTSPHKVNRLGTENYQLGGVTHTNFDKNPTNLIVDQKTAYLKDMMKTKSNEAKVHCFLTKWSVDARGSMMRVLQSDNFKMQGEFKPHKNKEFELNVSEDGKHVYIINKVQDSNMEVKIWSTETLSELKNEKINAKMSKVLYENKGKYIFKIIILNNLKHWGVYLRSQENNLEHFKLYQYEKDQFTHIFHFDCSEKSNWQYSKFDLCPLKVLIEVPKDKQEKAEDFWDVVTNQKLKIRKKQEVNESPPEEPERPFLIKILYVLKVHLNFKNSQNQDVKGCPWFLVDIDTAKNVKDQVLEKIQSIDLSPVEVLKGEKQKKDGEKQKSFIKTMQTKNEKSLDFNENLHGQIFIFDKEHIDAFENLEISFSRHCEYVAFISNTPSKNIFCVFSKSFSKIKDKKCFGWMSQNISKKHQMEFVRNQKQKSQMYCVTKSNHGGNHVYKFSNQDQKSLKKQMTINNLHSHAKIDCCWFKDEQLVGILSQENQSQRINFKIFEPIHGKYEMEFRSNRNPNSQQIDAQYPCVATNLGLSKICIHLNKNVDEPQCLIYDFEKMAQSGESNTEQEDPEQFMGFINMDELKNLGFDQSYISIDTCSRFVYLTSTTNKVLEDPKKDFLSIWINILIVDSFNRFPEIAHFKSSKIFKLTLDKNKNCLDLLQCSKIYNNGEDHFLLLQYPRQIFRKKLNPDNRKDEKERRKVNAKRIIKKVQSYIEEKMDEIIERQNLENPIEIENVEDQQVERSQEDKSEDEEEKKEAQEEDIEEEEEAEILANASDSSSDDGNQSQEDDKFLSKKKMTLKYMLQGFMVPFAMIQNQDTIIFATTSDETQNLQNQDFKIEIKQFNTKQDSVQTIFTIRQSKVIAFKQLEDGRFILIDHEGELNIFSKSKNGQKLLRQGNLFLHESDVEYIVEKLSDYEDIIIDENLVIVGSKVCYIQKKPIEGVLESYDLKRITKSDYDFKLVRGPIINNGQQQFVQIFQYNDSDDVDYYQFRQKIFNFPTSNKLNLINDFNHSCLFSTFLNKRQILAQFGHRFFQFNENGLPIDEIEFNQKQRKGHDFDDRDYHAIYWHQHLFENDHSGVNKLIMVTPKNLEDLTEKEAYQAKNEIKKAKKEIEKAIKARKALVEAEELKKTLEEAKKSKTEIEKAQIKIQYAKKAYETCKEAENEAIQEALKVAIEAIPQILIKNLKSKLNCKEIPPFIVVRINKSFGLKKIQESQTNQITAIQVTQCLDQAKNEYFQRFELITMSEDNQYFMFFDNFLQKFQLWKLNDKSASVVNKFLEKGQQKYDKLKESSSFLKEQQEKIYKNPSEVRHLRLIDQKRLIKKYMQKINLKGSGITISKEPQEDQTYSIHKLNNLLNNNKTKYRCEIAQSQDQTTGEEIIDKDDQNYKTAAPFVDVIIEFEEPQEISAFGFQSANNYPHLDPSRIQVFISGKEFEEKEIIDDQKATFAYRFQIKNYLFQEKKISKVSKVKFRFYAQEKAENQLQLSQILLFKRKQHFDFSFTKIKNLDFWKWENNRQLKLITGKEQGVNQDNNSLNILANLWDNDLSDPLIKVQKCIQFLKQSNVTKHIRIVEETQPQIVQKGNFFDFMDKKSQQKKEKSSNKVIQVIFAFCDQYAHESELPNITNDFKGPKQVQPIKYKIDLIGQIFSGNQVESEETLYFKKTFQVDFGRYLQDQLRIKNDIQRQMKKNELFRLKQQQLPFQRRDFKKQIQLQSELRAKIFELSLMVQVHFGRKWVVIQESQTIQTIKFENLLRSKQEKNNRMFSAFDNILNKDDDYQKEFKILPKEFQLPSQGQQILNIYFVRSNSAKNEDVIQIQAYDLPNQVLIAATWNIDSDNEVQMYQTKCLHKYPKTLFLQGICEQPYYTNEELEDAQEDDDGEEEADQEEKKHVKQGDSGYLLQEDLVIDLKNNIPFIYTNDSQEQCTHNRKHLRNEKKIYCNSSRFLGINEPHQLIFDHTLKDTTYWRDITLSEYPLDLLEQNEDILSLFRLKYKGISLFHNFASKYEDKQLDQLISLVYSRFIKAKEEDSLQELSVKNMPLFLLSPDDTNRYTALQIAIDSKKPNIFEMMVGMLKDFDEICSSKMMLGNFTSLMNRQALEYFDKAQFNPPLLQASFAINWPADAEQIVFTCETSLLTQKILSQKIKERVQFQKSEIRKFLEYLMTKFVCINLLVYRFLYIFLFFVPKLMNWLFQLLHKIYTKLYDSCCQKKNKKTKKSEHNLKNSEDQSESKQVTVIVQALDFDWIFDGKNIESFIMLLNDNDSNNIYDQYSIKIFVEFMWEHYRRKIKMWEFIPYLVKLISLIMLSTADQLNLINKMKTLSDEGEVIQEKPDNLGGLIVFQLTFQIIAIFMILQYLLREAYELSNEGWRTYFSSIWNVWGLVTELYCLLFIGSLFILLRYLDEGITLDQQRFWRQLSAYAVFMLWIKMFYWASLWDGPAYFIIQLEKTTESVGGFLVMFSLIILSFANFFFIIQLNVPEGGWKDEEGKQYNYVEESVGNKYLDAIISMYLASLGEFNSSDAYVGGYNVKSAWMMFLLATVVLLLTFLNMLIAVMSEPFEDVKENKDAYVLRKKVSLIVTYLDLIDLKEEFGKNKYIMIVKPEDIEEDDERNDHVLLEESLQKSNEIFRSMMLMRDDVVERLATIERNLYQPPEEQKVQEDIQPEPQPQPHKKREKVRPEDLPASKQDWSQVMANLNSGKPLFKNSRVRLQVINSIYKSNQISMKRPSIRN